jgi:Putative peptidoglycan binding domain
MKRLIFTIISLSMLALPLRAQIFEGGFGGALSGAMLGSLVGGRSGAAWGAAIGGGVGMIEGANERSRQKEAEAAFRRQQEERAAWQREDALRRQREMEMLAAKKECCLPNATNSVAAPASESLIVLETKKSLVRMGYDTGPIDNQLNGQTVQAIKIYESKYNLLVTGRPSQELLKHMLQHGG